MAKATSHSTTPPLSSLFIDPVVRHAFERAERDNGDTFAIPTAPGPVLTGGPAVALRDLELA